jgi:hypothetical protein
MSEKRRKESDLYSGGECGPAEGETRIQMKTASRLKRDAVPDVAFRLKLDQKISFRAS